LKPTKKKQLKKKRVGVPLVNSDPDVDTRLADLLTTLDFEPTDIVETARIQPGLFMQCAALRIEKMQLVEAAKNHVLRTKQALDETRATTAQEIRENADAGEKISEKVMDERLLCIDEVTTAHAALLDAKEAQSTAELDEEFVKYLVDSYKQRKDVLQMCASLLSGEQRNITGMQKITRGDLAKDAKRRFPKGD
jgi:hypothetical protein